MTYEGYQCSNSYRDDYSEAYALQTLLREANFACDESDELLEKQQNNRSAIGAEHFTICIGGRSIDFFAGGPQIDALCEFVAAIAGENLYSVNRKKSRVIDCRIVRYTDYCPYKDNPDECLCDPGKPCEACML